LVLFVVITIVLAYNKVEEPEVNAPQLSWAWILLRL